jgi:hypothetical protein
MKRAQANQIFTWLIAAIMLALVVLFGFRAIMNMRTKGEQVRYLEFKNDLETNIETTTDYGSERRVTLRVPGGYQQLCLINTEGGFPDHTLIDDPIISDSVESQVINNVKNENAFLVKDIADQAFYVGEIKIEENNGYLCIDVESGEVELRIEGFGRYAKVSR